MNIQSKKPDVLATACSRDGVGKHEIRSRASACSAARRSPSTGSVRRHPRPRRHGRGTAQAPPRARSVPRGRQLSVRAGSRDRTASFATHIDTRHGRRLPRGGSEGSSGSCGRLSPPAVRRRRCRRSPRDRDAHRASGRRPTSPSRNTPACARAASPRGCRAMSRRLQILSASFTSFARRLMVAACSTCRRLRSSFGNDLSSVTSITMSATSLPNSRSSSCSVVSVSSTVSCNTAATITFVLDAGLVGQHVGECDRMIDVRRRFFVLAPLIAMLVCRECDGGYQLSYSPRVARDRQNRPRAFRNRTYYLFVMTLPVRRHSRMPCVTRPPVRAGARPR